jgi:hypothetical protein
MNEIKRREKEEKERRSQGLSRMSNKEIMSGYSENHHR